MSDTTQESEIREKTIGFALSGGGGKGGFQAGILWRLWKAGITPSVISSISVGALNGIMAATGQYDEMKHVWQTVTDDMVRRKRNPVSYAGRFLLHKIGIGSPQLGFWQNDPLKELLRRHILGQTTICDYYTGIVDPQTDQFEHVYIPAGLSFTDSNVDRYVDIIVASTAIPIIFEPVRIGDKLYIDGGVHFQNPLRPLSKLIDSGMEYIIGISMKGKNESRKSEISDDLDMIQYVVSSLTHQTAEEDFERFELINTLARKAGGEFIHRGKTYRNYPHKLFRPKRELSPDQRFHYQFARDDFMHGENLAAAWLQEII